MFGVTQEGARGPLRAGRGVVDASSSGIWAGEGPFDFEGKHYQLQGVEGSPLPVRGAGADHDERGQLAHRARFAMRYSDMHFDGVQLAGGEHRAHRRDQATGPRGGPASSRSGRRSGSSAGPPAAKPRSSCSTSSTTRTWAAVGHLADMHERDAEGPHRRRGRLRVQRRRPDRAAGAGARVVLRRRRPRRASPSRSRDCTRSASTAWCSNFVNYLDEFPYFVQEVLPRLERLGLREKALSQSEVGDTPTPPGFRGMKR